MFYHLICGWDAIGTLLLLQVAFKAKICAVFCCLQKYFLQIQAPISFMN